MAVRVPEIDYYSLHGIWGAYASLALGRVGRGAGVVIGDVRPPQGGLFVGYRIGRDEPRLLPFSSGINSNLGASAYREDDVDSGRVDSLRRASYFHPKEIERRVSFSGEEWRAGALSFTIAPGQKTEYIIALGVFRDGIVTAGRPTHAYYTCLFKDIEDVLESALDEQAESLFRANRIDSFLDNSDLSEDRRFLLAHAAHSYVANTELLLSESGEPVFLVNEGEYQMMNTLDLTIDQAFWEARFSPWTLRNELESFEEHSSYKDSLGVAFAHDQGVDDCFTPPGRSVYELPGLTDCFSFMSYEETLNWTISACLYVNLTGDWSWAKDKEKVALRMSPIPQGPRRQR